MARNIQKEHIMAKKKPKKFIQKAIKKPGALTATAKKKGMTPAEFCDQPKSKISKTSQKRCNLRKTLVGLNKKGKK